MDVTFGFAEINKFDSAQCTALLTVGFNLRCPPKSKSAPYLLL